MACQSSVNWTWWRTGESWDLVVLCLTEQLRLRRPLWVWSPSWVLGHFLFSEDSDEDLWLLPISCYGWHTAGRERPIPGWFNYESEKSWTAGMRGCREQNMSFWVRSKSCTYHTTFSSGNRSTSLLWSPLRSWLAPPHEIQNLRVDNNRSKGKACNVAAQNLNCFFPYSFIWSYL